MKWDYQKIATLLQEGVPEDDHLDYKREVVTKSSEVVADIVAFANTSGGVLIYGVDDKRTAVPQEICGTDRYLGREPIDDWVVKVVKGRTGIPGDCYDTHIIDIPESEGKVILVVTVQRSPLLPHMVEDSFPIRDHRNSRPATQSEVDSMYSQKFGRPMLGLDIDFLENSLYRPILKLVNAGQSTAFDISGYLYLCRDIMSLAEIKSTPHNHFVTPPQQTTMSILQAGESMFVVLPELYKWGQGFINLVHSAVWVGNFEDVFGSVYKDFEVEFPVQDWIASLREHHVWPLKLLNAPINEVAVWDLSLAKRMSAIHEGP